MPRTKLINIFISRMYTATILGASKEELKEIRLKGERTPKNLILIIAYMILIKSNLSKDYHKPVHLENKH